MFKFGVIGADHRHIYHLIEQLLLCGLECAGVWERSSDPKVLQGIRERFPQLPMVQDQQALLQDPAIELIVTAAVPCDRAGIAVEAMRHGKDVLCDKPGIVDYAQLALVEQVAQETGRIFSICFSERMVVPAVNVALQLVQQGAIGRVIQTMGMGPHRLNAQIRPDWFFDKTNYGGILVDIASHQIDQYICFTGASDAVIESAFFGHFGSKTQADFQDFGELILSSRATASRGYVRVDWFTPDGLPTWGDGRLFILGTDGHIELRKYLDIEGRPGTDHLLLANHEGTRYIDCAAQPLDFFAKLAKDVVERTATAMTLQHVLQVTRLALDADRIAQARQLEPLAQGGAA